MSTSVTLNGVSYSIPAVGEDNWGTSVSNYLIALSTGVLSKAGGSFTLTADADFGATYGLKVAYYKSRGTVATTGILRLANAEMVSWRNAANSANYTLGVDSNNRLTLDTAFTMTGALKIGATGAADDSLHIASANARAVFEDTSEAVKWTIGTGFNTGYFSIYDGANQRFKVKSDGVIEMPAYTTGLAHFDSSGVVTSSLLVNADVDSSAAIAYSKLNLSSSIVNADISASAAIALTKLAATTASRALVSDGSGLITASSVTSTELGYVSGVTSAIQTQLGTKAPLASPTFTGTVLLQNSSGAQPELHLSEDPDNGTNVVKIKAPATLSADYTLTLPTDDGTSNQVLTTDGSGVLSWSSPLTNPMDSAGDLIVGGASGTATKLDHPGAANYLLATTGASTTAWTQSPTITDLTITNQLTVDTNTIAVDPTTNRVGLVKSSPSFTLDIGSGDVALTAAADQTFRMNTASNAVGISKVYSTDMLQIYNGSASQTRITVSGSNTANQGIKFDNYTTTGIIHNDSSGNLTTSLIVNADVSGSAAIDGSKIVSATNSVSGVITTSSQNIAGVKTFYDGIKLDDAAGQSTLSYYAEVDTSGVQWNGTGGLSSAFTVRCTRIGRNVTVHIPSAAAAMSSTASSISNDTTVPIPAGFRPPVNAEFAINSIYNNSAKINSAGILRVTTSGGLTIFRDGSGTVFTGSGSAGIAEDVYITYSV